MLLAVSALLWDKTMKVDSVLVAIEAFAMGAYVLQSRRMHEKQAAYLANVDPIDSEMPKNSVV